MKYKKPFLKWAGGKYRILDTLLPILPPGKRFVEPFVGSGVVSLNTDYPIYWLNDANTDLIRLYITLQSLFVEQFLKDAARFFVPECNTKEYYLECRKMFNMYRQPRQFLYLNRHGFNGLCRYNKKGMFNVPFGSYKKPYFPLKEMRIWSAKFRSVSVTCSDFKEIIYNCGAGDIIYCDPPYLPLSKTSSFTDYFGKFGIEEHERLTEEAIKAAERGARVLISNHDVPLTRELYKIADIVELKVSRTIAAKGKSRKQVREIIAIF